ncbi:MAG: hypothetical protein RLZZ471_586 [Actinomycetota bacterium]|jgi:thiamine transport system permease protein
MGRNLQKLALWAVPLLFVAVLFYWAIAKVLVLGFEQNWLAIFADTHFLRVVGFTVGQALLSTLLCLAFGIPGAYLLYRKKFFGRSFLRALISVPFVLPTILVAIAFQGFANLVTPLAAILIAHLFLNYSIVVRTVGGVWSKLDAEIDNAAEIDGASNLQRFFLISLPMLKSGIASAAVLVFLYCVTSFGIILLIGGGTQTSIETEIYFSLTQFLDFKTASTYAIMQTLITVIAFGISKRIGNAEAGIETTNETDSSTRLRLREWPIVTVTVIFILVILVLPILGVLSKFTWRGFLYLSGNGQRGLLNISVWQAVANSTRNILIAASLSVVIGVLVSWLLSRSKRSWLEIPFLMPMGISSVVLGFGYLLTIRAGWLTVPLVQALLATPLVIRIVHPALISLGSDYRDVAVNAGANGWQTWRLVEAPMLAAVLRSAAVFAGLVSLGEFGAASLLSYGDQATLPVVLYQLIARPGPQNYAMAMAACALLIIFVFAISMSSSLIQTRRRSS